MNEAGRRRWDIFCTVVDNYGDIGVCWRLARQLAAEHGVHARLWVDSLETFQRLCPEIDPARQAQVLGGVDIRHWTKPFVSSEPADVVVEAFACTLPEAYIAAMAARTAKPVWINLEHLSAEDWVSGCHGLASPQPRLPLVKHFFYPGFSAQTGGLLREVGLMARRCEFQGDQTAIGAFWHSLGLPGALPGQFRVSLFCYPNPAALELFEAWAQGPEPILCLVPQGIAKPEISRFSGSAAGAHGVFARGNLEIRVLPFLAQDGYDRLLWACDWNFVRGEDSFVRAQWAQRPMVWQAYPQQDGAHLAKLSAFLNRYCAGLSEEPEGALRAIWDAWNAGHGAGEAWARFASDRTALLRHAATWAQALAEAPDLASNLVDFCNIRV